MLGSVRVGLMDGGLNVQLVDRFGEWWAQWGLVLWMMGSMCSWLICLVCGMSRFVPLSQCRYCLFQSLSTFLCWMIRR